MSSWLTVENLVTPKVQSMLAGLSPERRAMLMGRLGKQLETDLKAHFVARDSEGNKRGWPSMHFWSREVRAKTALQSYDASQATVGVSSPAFAHRVRGGVIRPGPGKKLLAIPTRGEVYGRMPSANPIPGIFFVRTGKGTFLAAREGKALRIYWKLVPSVNQAPDARALPRTADLQASLEARAEQELGRILQQ